MELGGSILRTHENEFVAIDLVLVEQNAGVVWKFGYQFESRLFRNRHGISFFDRAVRIGNPCVFVSGRNRSVAIGE